MAGSNPYRSADEILRQKAAAIVSAARALGLTIVTAESCTAGRVAATLADVPGASEAVHGGFVTYTEVAKISLGVREDVLKRYDPVSEEVAREMARAALARCPADISIAVTGVVGPTTNDDGDPVGLVYFSTAHRGKPTEIVKKEFGKLERDTMLFNIVEEALGLLDRAVQPESASVK
ncbi:MAG: CinA family protein [Pseudorhodoplanes sp.]